LLISQPAIPEECNCKFHKVCIKEWLNSVGQIRNCPSCGIQISKINNIGTTETANERSPQCSLEDSADIIINNNDTTESAINIVTRESAINIDTIESAINISYLPPTNLHEAVALNSKNHLDVLNTEKTDRMVISVRRRNIWNDAVSKFKKLSLINLVDKPLYVDFIGEDGDDFGGLTREFFAEVFKGAEGHVLQGPSDRLTFMKNRQKLDGREYYVLGLLTALALLHGCPGPHNLSKRLAAEIVEIDSEIGDNFISDIPDFDLQEKLKVITEASAADSKNLMIHLEERYDAGVPVIGDISTKEFCKIITDYRLIGLNHKEISQFKEGLSFVDILATMKNFPEDAMKELTAQAEVGVDDFKRLFKIEYSEEPSWKAKEEDIIFNFFTMLEDIAAEKLVPVSSYDPFSEQMVLKDMRVNDILGHFTGSTSISHYINKSKIKVKFLHNTKEGAGFVCNTCQLSILFPVTQRYATDFRTSFFDSMLNSPGFTRV